MTCPHVLVEYVDGSSALFRGRARLGRRKRIARAAGTRKTVFGSFPIQVWLANWSQVGLGLVVHSQHGLVWN